MKLLDIKHSSIMEMDILAIRMESLVRYVMEIDKEIDACTDEDKINELVILRAIKYEQWKELRSQRSEISAAYKQYKQSLRQKDSKGE